ncbi:NAD-dependent epimerase/dehydratase family protein [Rhizobium sp. C4]|uniref:NAD-dependent epimerase/dehydratase family protein n=1 Tax=Rhizobium sp. C4 TaxID=1349800 RepID=UPI001E54858F|nr:NAD(P)-dependent oxidoreductase [Rhizobium sp. C4]MCD2171752.1 NAD(P)-dependent oxidoreductase [Rhizobium sp. C4]
MKKRILFTGGSGKAGRHVIPWLIAKGYEVHNIDLVPLNVPGVTNLTVDITDLGEVFNALTMHRDFPDLESGRGVQPFDAVVHFAAVPRILILPDNETYRVNVMGTYNVIEASVKLGIRKVIIASSETTYGICFAEGDRDPHYLPFDEDYDVNPMDSYGLSKVINEKTARAFSERTGADIYALRIGNVIEPNEYSRFPGFVAHPETRLRNAWSYIDARDLGQIVHLCIEKDGLGYQVFNATNDTVTTDLSTAELAQRFFPNVPLKWQPVGDEAMISNRKIRGVLGFREEHNWRKYV